VAGVARDGGEDSGGIKFVAAPGFAYFLFFIGASITGFGAWRIFRDTARPSFALICFVVFLGALATSALVRALRLRGVVLEVGPQGILDRRLSDTLIPWSAITDVSTYDSAGIYAWAVPKDARLYLKLRVDPAFEARWKLLARLQRKSIGVLDLNGGSFDDLENAVQKFWERSKQRS
jgi:hypothetical protein